MSIVQSELADGVIVVHGWPGGRMSDDEFLRFCNKNEHLRFEQNAEGDLIVIPPTGGTGSHRNALIVYFVTEWALRDGTGLPFDSDGKFQLPNTARRSPDAAWILYERWNRLSEEEQEGISPISPDFVVELRSRTDRLSMLQDKMREYMDNGSKLGWLIDPYERKVEVFRPGRPPEVLESPESVSGDPELPGFVMEMKRIWAR